MGRYAQKHHPQVQARKAGRLTLNSFRRDQYIDRLRRAGVPIKSSIAKMEAFKLVVENQLDMAAYSWRLPGIENAPLGTTAPALGGGHWTRTDLGWEWCTGSTFPRPSGDWDGRLIPPPAEKI